MRYFIGLALMDTSLPDNAHLITAIKRDAIRARILDAFLTSAPQFILQLTIILRTGKYGEFSPVIILPQRFENL